MKKLSVSAALAAGLLASGLSIGSASAADLGGDCCADLEERVAELEATTARKGNRKVSLTISGWVAEQVVYWDDGQESNVYVTGIGRTLQSHFKLTGSATIAPGWSAGYVMHVEVGTVDAFTYGAASDESANLAGLTNDTGNGLYTLQSFWFIKSDRLGKLSVGKQSQASDNTAILVDGSGSLVPANWLNIDGDGLGAVNQLGHCHTINDGIGGGGKGAAGNTGGGEPPTLARVSGAAPGGGDDMWDVAARYAGEFNGIKVAVAAAYSRVSDENLAVIPNALAASLNRQQSDKDVGYFQIGAYVQHVPTGLFLYGAYGKEYGDVNYTSAASILGFANGTARWDADGDHWYVKAGVRQKWTPLGATVLYGEYGQMNDMFGPSLTNDPNSTSELTKWGLGVVQEIDAAAMSLWLSYRNYEGDAHDSNGRLIAGSDTDVHYVKAGALINF